MRSTYFIGLAVCLLLAGSSPARADAQADARAIVEKAVKAMGGQEKLARLNTCTLRAKGSIEAGQQATFAEETSMRWPDYYHFDLDFDFGGQKVKEVFVCASDKGWIKINEDVMEMPKELLTTMKDYFYALMLPTNPAELLSKEYTLSPLGEIKVGERIGVGVQASRKGRRDVNVYFDKETGLPVKAETNAPKMEGGQDVGQEFLLSEYKEMDGAQVATKLLWNQDGKKFVEREYLEIKPQDKFDDSTFAKP
jgi:hypothetical protein